MEIPNFSIRETGFVISLASVQTSALVNRDTPSVGVSATLQLLGHHRDLFVRSGLLGVVSGKSTRLHNAPNSLLDIVSLRLRTFHTTHPSPRLHVHYSSTVTPSVRGWAIPAESDSRAMDSPGSGRVSSEVSSGVPSSSLTRRILPQWHPTPTQSSGYTDLSY